MLLIVLSIVLSVLLSVLLFTVVENTDADVLVLLFLYLRGIDFVQERFMGAGPQDNESAAEQMKDRMIAETIRGQYKSTTGKDFPSNRPRQT